MLYNTRMIFRPDVRNQEEVTMRFIHSFFYGVENQDPLILSMPLTLAMILVWRFKQVRFAQYTIVVLPVILYQIFYHTIPWFRQDLPPYFTAILIGTACFMGVLNIILSKRLGEF